MAKHEDDDEVVEDDEVESDRIISVLAETNRRDRWTVAPNTSMFTVLARSHFDFRKVEAQGDTVEIDIVCVCGNITLVVPEGTKVQLSGFSFLASANSDVADPEGEQHSHLPKLIVNATTVLGKLHIRTPNESDAPPIADTAIETTAEPLPVAAAAAAAAPAEDVWGTADATDPAGTTDATDATDATGPAEADDAAAPATVAEASGVAPDAIDEPREPETVGAA